MLFDLHLNLITFTRKYYLYYVFVFFLLPLICNNSCILRDATVCVLCSFFLFSLWGCDFLLAIAQLVVVVVGGC